MVKQTSLTVMSDAIAAIWRAAGEPVRWNDAMLAINRLMPECHGFVAITPFAEGPGNIWETIQSPDGFMEEYGALWQGRDTTLHAVARRMPVEHMVFDIADIVPDPSRCDIWQNLYVPHGINDMSAVTVNGAASGGAEALLLAGFCDRRLEREGLRRRAVFSNLVPHLGGATALHWRLVRAESRSTVTKSILDRLALGIVALDGRGCVTEINRAAKRMLDARDGLLFSTGKLHTKELSAQRELERAVATVLAGGAERPLSLRRERGSPLTIIVTPTAVDPTDALGRSARAIVFISDPDQVPDNAGTRVAALYGLTRSEAEIAQGIASGKNIGDIAKARGTNLSTARTQLKTLMSKIGASRQSDVVRSLLAISILDER